jgi:hypothetical protein
MDTNEPEILKTDIFSSTTDGDDESVENRSHVENYMKNN